MTDIFREQDKRDLRAKGYDPESELDLIRIIEECRDLYDVKTATILLRDIGTSVCIPSLKKAMYYSKADVQVTSLWTIGMIAGISEREFYLEALLDPHYRQKMTAIEQISRYCGAEAVIPVCKRVRKLLPKKRGWIAWHKDRTELTIALEYLASYVDIESAVSKTFDFVLSQWKQLADLEKSQLIERIQYFKDHVKDSGLPESSSQSSVH